MQYPIDPLAPPGKSPLDESREFIGQFIDASESQLDAVTLWIAHTFALESFVTTPRLLITSPDAGTGKTMLLQLVQSMSRNGWSAIGTSFALKAKMAEPSRPTLAIDEVSDIFGRAGMAGSNNPLGTLLRIGYRNGAIQSFAQNHTVEEINVFCAVALTGRGAAVPNDIRTRCITIAMKVGRPAEDYLVREHDPESAMLRAALGQWVTQRLDEIGDYRAKGIHEKMHGRRREVWEPLLAIAHVAGGSWPRRAVSAYLDLALDDSDQPRLTPEQTVLRDMARACDELDDDQIEQGCALGADLRALMRQFGERMYESLPDRSLSMRMARPVPHAKRVITIGSRRGNGYVLDLIRKEWEARRPPTSQAELIEADMSDPDAVEEVSPSPARHSAHNITDLSETPEEAA